MEEQISEDEWDKILNTIDLEDNQNQEDIFKISKESENDQNSKFEKKKKKKRLKYSASEKIFTQRLKRDMTINNSFKFITLAEALKKSGFNKMKKMPIRGENNIILDQLLIIFEQDENRVIFG